MAAADYEKDLQALRQAADARDPEQTQFLLKRLLQMLPLFPALAVAAEQVHNSLAAFERQHPQESWARQLLLVIVNYGQAPDAEVIGMALEKLEGPGTANFLKALHDLVQAMQERYPPEARVGYLVSAVVNAIMAALVEGYYAERPQDWERVRLNRLDPATGTYSDPQATEIAYRFWTADEVAAQDTGRWLAVADAVERALVRSL